MTKSNAVDETKKAVQTDSLGAGLKPFVICGEITGLLKRRVRNILSGKETYTYELVICEPAFADEHVNIPATSVRIWEKDGLIRLKNAIDDFLGEESV